MWPYFVAAFATFIDQATKWFTLDHVQTIGQPVPLTSFLNLTIAWNRGVSYGWFSASSETGKWLLVGLGSFLCFVLLNLMAGASRQTHRYAYALILGGAIGNIIDRLNYGAVYDFIDFHLNTWHFYTFNMADAFISLGVFVMVCDYLFYSETKKET